MSTVDDGGRTVNPIAALLAVVLATIVSSTDTAILNVALPRIRAEFDAGSSVTLAVTANLVGIMLAMPASTWLAARFGTRRPILVSIAVFGACSLLTAAAPGLWWLVAGRTAAGLASAPLIPVCMKVVTTVFPPERRGFSMAVWSGSAVIGPTIGPVVGGTVAAAVSWRWLFIGTPLLAAAAFAAAWRSIPDLGRSATRPPFDTVGMLLGPPGLSLVVVGLTRGQKWGWTAPATLTLLVGGTLLTLVFLGRALRVRHPLLDLRLVRVPNYALGMTLGSISMLMQQARLVYVPLELDDVQRMSIRTIGLLFLPVAAASAVGMLVAGRVSDRNGPRVPVILGGAAMAVGSALMAAGRPTRPLWETVAGMSVQALGHGIFMATAVVVCLSRVDPDRLAAAGTMRQVAMQLGGVFSSALLGMILAALRDPATTQGAIQHAYNVVFIAVTVVAALIFLLTFRVPKGPLHR